MLEHNPSKKLKANEGFETNFSEQKARWEVSLNGSKLLEYVYGEVDDINPSFRLVKTTDEHTISLYRPWDHPWHPGLFFSWKYINGYNFWEAKYHGEQNRVVTDSFIPMEEGSIGFRQALSYINHEGENLLQEKRVVTVEEELDGYLIHWQASYTPTNNAVTLSSSENTEKTPWGGYGGLSCRLSRNLLRPAITTDLGSYTAEEAFSIPFKWCDYSGKLDGYIEEEWAGICIFDHPLNMRYPSPKLTYDYKDMQFMTAAILFNKPYLLNMSETLHLNYSFYIHDNKAEKENLNRIWNKLRS
ncbi:DUF6807 family protein [Gracilibacillus sp. D59]|uniref:DUF6807 family protein n=1 Tax=Gracilibacillus sp. D59 TaxID=3457434 RepID=UPI003FCD62AF